MKCYRKECRRIASSLIYYLFIAILIFNWFQNFHGITQTEIDMANGISSNNFGFNRPLLKEPTKADNYFGSKTSEDDPDRIMMGVTRMLLMEYKNNRYATYPVGYYKAITLSSEEQSRVLEILCEITGLTEEQLNHLPKGYFPAVTGTIISTDNLEMDENGNIVVPSETTTNPTNDKTKKFISQVTYEHFKELMHEMETIIGERGSNYSEEMMITYFGISEMTYEEAYAQYQQTIQEDKVTNGFARLFCDYIGLVLGLYPIFLIVIICLKDQSDNTAELIYSRKISSIQLVVCRYLASITMILIPILFLSFESLLPLISFGLEHRIAIDCFGYIKYILWWLLPTTMIVCAFGTFFTLLTDSPIAIILQFLWWNIDKGITSLSGDTQLMTLMIRHNTLNGYELIQKDMNVICINRFIMAGISILLIALSVWILEQKRKGNLNAINVYKRCLEHFKNKLSFSHTK